MDIFGGLDSTTGFFWSDMIMEGSCFCLTPSRPEWSCLMLMLYEIMFKRALQLSCGHEANSQLTVVRACFFLSHCTLTTQLLHMLFPLPRTPFPPFFTQFFSSEKTSELSNLPASLTHVQPRAYLLATVRIIIFYSTFLM